MIVPAPGDSAVKGRVSPTGTAAGASEEPEAADSPASRVPAPPVAELTAEQRSILAALAAGLIDGHAAKLLGLSDRTFARRVAELMALLGATSRFQLGMQAPGGRPCGTRGGRPGTGECPGPQPGGRRTGALALSAPALLRNPVWPWRIR